MPSQFAYPGSGPNTRAQNTNTMGNIGHDPYRGYSVTGGEDYGSYMGFPVRRVQGPGMNGMEINFNGEWMPMGEFQNRDFQTAFVQPWLQKDRQEKWNQGVENINNWWAENHPGQEMPSNLAGSLAGGPNFFYMGGRSRYRSPGPVGSSGRGGMTPQMMQALMMQQGG